MPKDNGSIGYRITDLESNDRPCERLAEVGAQALSNAELLAILLRVGIPGENAVQLGGRLLRDLKGLSGIHQASFDEVCQQKGVGPAKAAQIKAAIELGRRLQAFTGDDRPAIHSPQDAADLVMFEMSALLQENLWVLHLDTRNRVVHTDRIYKGSLNSSTVRVGELFKAAIQRNAAAVILVHNHPSGDPGPSPEDIQLTRAAVQAGKLLDIKVLDHLVIGHGRFVSLKERGLGFDA
ncbi:DNA repair protein RadC [Ornatilinea apprima]|uniref:DNA repair protein RadC n=1 Tax=Ornatilinea apprima TaxID=1134406 RepID=A0A0N8GMR5_9CHLR|nr:DNA repair protein RadC [Ornatilinea apprima]KPL76034.1 DNA repair protein RadC [Ornatilinea apprima]